MVMINTNLQLLMRSSIDVVVRCSLTKSERRTKMQQVKLLSHSSAGASCEGLFEDYTSPNCPFSAFYHPLSVCD